MKSIFLGITWASAGYIIYVPALAVVLGVIGWQYAKRKTAVALLASSRWSKLLLPNFSFGKQWAKMSCLLVGFTMLFVALLQPQWDKKEEPIVQEGRDLCIALDISRSMLAQDVAPSRLMLAKKKIKQLLPMLQSDRVCLLLFSGTSVVQCPLTCDYSAFTMFLDQIDATTVSSGTTALDKAIEKALDVFGSVGTKNNKLLVVFTDGEDFSSNLAVIKDKAQRLGLRIVTLGVGTTQGAPIPLIDEFGSINGHQRDANGSIVISALNEGILSSLAENLNGLYVPITEDNSDLSKLVSYVNVMEKEKFDDKKVPALQEQYHYFIAASFICFLIEWLL